MLNYQGLTINSDIHALIYWQMLCNQVALKIKKTVLQFNLICDKP